MISGIILAAGLSKRMGEPKQVLRLGGKPMLQQVVDTFLRSGLDEVVVVMSPNIGWRPGRRRRLRLVENPLPELGISTSLKVGLDSTNPRSEAVVIGLGDKPLLTEVTIQKMIEAYTRTSSEIIVPVYHGKRGNPILFRHSLFAEMSRLRGDKGAKILINRKKRSVMELPVTDLGVNLDVNTPRDLERAERLISARLRLAKRKSRK